MTFVDEGDRDKSGGRANVCCSVDPTCMLPYPWIR